MPVAGVLESTRPEHQVPCCAQVGIREPLAQVEETANLEWEEDEIGDTRVPVPALPLTGRSGGNVLPGA